MSGRIRLTSSFCSTITTVQKHSQGVGHGNLQQTSPARAVQGGDALASLEHPHRETLLVLDSLLHPFPSTAPSTGTWCYRSQRLSLVVGSWAPGSDICAVQGLQGQGLANSACQLTEVIVKASPDCIRATEACS